MTLLAEGQVFRDTYEVERFLGEGAFAEVHRVRHCFLGRQAMKVFKAPGMTRPEIETLLGEALLLSRLGHPNIVRVFDANILETDSGMHGFFTMEYVAGGSLDQFWRSHGTALVPIETSVDLIKQVCRGLSVAHSESPPIVHRDIKPQNILVGYDGTGLRVRVSDFGLAKRVNPLTLQASARGTRAFKAPETYRNFHGDSRAGDVWALGCTLYLLLTDRLPYAEKGQWDAHDPARFQIPLILPSQLNVRVDAALDFIALRALELEPQKRYKDATELLRALDSWSPAVAPSAPALPASESLSQSKGVIGASQPADRTTASEMLAEAIKLSKHAGKLAEASDLLEEAFNRWPTLREEHGHRLQLWRRGIAM